MKRRWPSLDFRCLLCVGALLLGLPVENGALAQSTPAHDAYYEICRRQGYLPGTRPMRRCIDAQRSIDLDPLSALGEYQLTPPHADTAPDPDVEGDFPGAREADALLKSDPETLLLGPDYRARGQGIYE